MNRSFSKIRHIQEANSKLEKRIINEGLVPLISIGDAITRLEGQRGTVVLDENRDFLFTVNGSSFRIKEVSQIPKPSDSPIPAQSARPTTQSVQQTRGNTRQ